MNSSLITGICVLFLCWNATDLEAGAYSGVVRSHSPGLRQITIQFKNGSLRTFPYTESTVLYLKGRTTNPTGLSVGQTVGVFTNRKGRAYKIIIRKEGQIQTPLPPRNETSNAPTKQPPANDMGKPGKTSNQTLSNKPPDSNLEKPQNKANSKLKNNATEKQKPPSQEEPASRNLSKSSPQFHNTPVKIVKRDWTQFRGPDRSNRSDDVDLLFDWNQTPPVPAWQARNLGEGYSSVSVQGNRVFTMGTRNNREVVFALDLKNGKELWFTPLGSIFKDGQGNGPRSTPTLDGSLLYALGANGDLACLDVKTGGITWRMNILSQFKGSNITWGISESVLIDGEKLICTPGGQNSAMIALKKHTGELLWRCAIPGNPAAGYASPIKVRVQGVEQYVTFTSQSLIGVRSSDGKLLWKDGSSANGTANCSAPIFEDSSLFSASGYGTGGALLKLSSSGRQTSATQVYHTKKMKNHHGGMVVVNGYLYGSDDPGILTCLELKTGKLQWKNRSVGKGSLTYADGHLYLRSEQGPMALIEANPKQYIEKGRMQQPFRSDRPAWSHPVVTAGKLFLRDQSNLLVYNLKAD